MKWRCLLQLVVQLVVVPPYLLTERTTYEHLVALSRVLTLSNDLSPDQLARTTPSWSPMLG